MIAIRRMWNSILLMLGMSEPSRLQSKIQFWDTSGARARPASPPLDTIEVTIVRD